MVARLPGNISGEATTQSGNIFNEAMRQCPENPVSARDQEAAPDAFTVATFVPPQADIGRLPKR